LIRSAGSRSSEGGRLPAFTDMYSRQKPTGKQT